MYSTIYGIVYIVKQELTEKELEILKQNLEGQNSDGSGSSFAPKTLQNMKQTMKSMSVSTSETEMFIPDCEVFMKRKLPFVLDYTPFWHCFNWCIGSTWEPFLGIYDVDKSKKLSREINYVTQHKSTRNRAAMRSRPNHHLMLVFS